MHIFNTGKLMRHLIDLIILAVVIFSGVYPCSVKADERDFSDLKLWYQEPAEQWTQALPIGNGRLGAMVFGGVQTEHIQFNEDTLWTGKPRGYEHVGAHKYLGQIRQLLFDGKQKQAEDMAMKEFMSVPLRQKAYQPFGDLYIDFPDHQNAGQYRRQLDLDTAVTTTSYKVNGTTFTRQMLASADQQVIVVHITADKKNAVTCTARLTSEHKQAELFARDAKMFVLRGDMSVEDDDSVLKYEAVLYPKVTNGSFVVTDDGINITDADSATFMIAAATSYNNFNDVSGDPEKRCMDVVAKAVQQDFETILSEHIASHRKLFRRVSIDLGSTDSAKLPTLDRLIKFKEAEDPQLISLIFQYGRYLLISKFTPRLSAGEFAGSLEQRAKARLGQQIYNEHKYRNELLAR